MSSLLDLSPRGWGRVIVMTVLGTLFCIVVAISLDQFNYASLDAVQVQRALWMNILVPLVLAGPLPAIDAEDPGPAGFTGSLVVAEFADLAAARAWAEADPYLEAGVYSQVDVWPFRQVLP